MAVEVTVNHKALPKGTEIEIPGIAVIPNGSSVILSDEQEEFFKLRHGKTVSVAYKKSGIFSTKSSTQAAYEKQEEKKAADSPKTESAAEEGEGGEKS